jgi:amino acid transporter
MPDKQKRLSREFFERITVLMVSAFGFVTALAWNEAISKTIASLGVSAYGPWAYAIIVTIIAVFVTFYIGKLKERLG